MQRKESLGFEETPHEGFKAKRSMTLTDEHHAYTVVIFVNAFNPASEEDRLTFEVHKRDTVEELSQMVVQNLENTKSRDPDNYDLLEVMGTLDGQSCKERRLDNNEYPVAVQLLWPKSLPTGPDDTTQLTEYRFVFRQKDYRASGSSSGVVSSTIDTFLAKFLQQPKDKEYPDLCMLPELTEQTLLENLRDRFNSGHIYTYIGPILVAMNPFKFYPIYNPKYAKLYQGRRLGSLPPHIFAIADSNYNNMLRSKQNQCIVISGESGSGKTESTNFLLHHLMTLSQKGSAATSLEQTLLCAGPVLEAFGNSVTAQNNNSSRFGKFIQINYRENGMVSGANVQIYLLEKSRIISQAWGERNYHVFYYLLEGATEQEKEDLFLLQPKDYHYLNQNNFYTAEGVDELYEFKRLCQSMELVGFGNESQRKIFSVLSAVLLLGNVQYVKRPGYHSDDNAHIANEELVGVISGLLEVRVENLLPALTTRKTVMRNETVVTRYKVYEAINTRDAMAKCLYNALFHWIVLRVNQALLKREMTALQKGFYIGILDIFGFEDVGSQWNCFEQFCINYANERLQAYFNQHIFQFEQEEYLNQGIPWTNIEFTDNTECLQLIQSKPYGLFSLIDEESSIAKATDESLLEKLNQFHKLNEYYEAPQKKETAFIIAHYAGKVKYQATGFREKNKDLMRQDVVNALKNSKSAFVRELVGNDPVAVFRWAVVRASFRAMSAFRQAGKQMTKAGSTSDLTADTSAAVKEAQRRGSESQLNAFLRGDVTSDDVPSFCDTSVFSTIVQHVKKKTPKKRTSQRSLRGLQALKALVGKRPQQVTSKKHHSVGAQFQSSLNRLMDTLSHATPYFIRCIKSNNEKIPNLFDEDIILRQLRYTGMLETVRIRRAGYSVRLDYDEFVAGYRILMPKGHASSVEDIDEFIQDHQLVDRANVQFGHSKLFMRDAEKLLLDDQLHRIIMNHILRLQGWFRTVTARRRFLRARVGIIKMQALVRGVLARQKVRQEALAALTVQTYWRSYYLNSRYVKMRAIIIQFQAYCKGFLFRQRFNKERNGFNSVDATVRQPSPRLFEINTFFQTFKLPSFDVNSFSTTAEDIEGESEESTSAEEIEDGSGTSKEEVAQAAEPFKRAPSVEAEFVLEDCKLKLVGKDVPEEKQMQAQNNRRRQSVAVASSSSDKANKIRMMRRAASTESDDILGIINGDSPDTKNSAPQSPTTKQLTKKRSGFFKAKKTLKSFLTRKSESLRSDSDEEDAEASLNVSSSPPSQTGKKPKGLTLWGSADRATSPPESHSLKLTRLHRAEKCALCSKNVSGLLLTQTYRCNSCKLNFHKECVQFANKIPCAPGQELAPSPSPATRRPWDVGFMKHSRQSLSPSASQTNAEKASFSLTRTQQQADPTNQILASIDDLRLFSVFIFKKQTELAQKQVKKRDTMVDAIFKKSLREFHTELISYEASLTEDSKNVLKYRDLITSFEGSLSKVCVQEQVSFPLTLGVNAFRGFLNEFMQQQKRKGNKTKYKGKSLRKKRRKSDVTVMHLGHRFKADIVHVPTYCEVCNLFMWHAEKIFICLGCRISCHKKCHSKLQQPCTSSSTESVVDSRRVFGIELTRLVDEDCPVPNVLEKLLLSIELRGLYVEGLYRKCGSVAQVKQLRRAIETTDIDKLDFDDSPVHVLTALVKSFFREMPVPLLTFELYENFLNVSEIDLPSERLRCLYMMVELLPKHNKAVLDRLMYHLARVAHQEEVNKMGCSNLAVIFSPCLLRRAQTVHAQDQLQDVQRQSMCIEALVQEKLRQYRSTMAEIVQLEHASETVSENLRKIDDHVRNSPDVCTPDTTRKEIAQARQLFMEQLEFLDKEKDKLIEDLPPLAPVASSEDDNLTSSDDTPRMDRKTKIVRDQEEFAIDLTNPPLFNLLAHPTKSRATRPRAQRRPSAAYLSALRSQ